ncbi:membrane-associated protein, putative [Bodo saltans]|uniref:Membrane-associated protein, putative n=1 Tax=Bodo saltans TaxID=75058 RepID=A0A0S4JR57_BODSA|nr:membrane-associated protein, putative [Bodo saltans]|eukprot:CUG92667.1 membrane-associated protein, putative [Bodo saltans]
MRSEPKTHREILNTLGELPTPTAPRWLDQWRAKTLENRHVVILLLAITVVLLVGFSVFAGKKNANASFGGHGTGDEHVYHAVHYSRDRPLEVLTIADLPPVDNDESAWSALVSSWDSTYGLIVILSPNVRLSRLQRLDGLLKVLSRPSPTKKEIQATWFFAAQLSADNNGVAFTPSSPRMMVTCTFHSLVLGHEVEFMSAVKVTSLKLRSRLGEGQGEVNNRFLILPATAVSQTVVVNDRLKEFAPVTLVWTNEESSAVQIRGIGAGASSGAWDVSARKPCVVRPFDVSDYKWKCSTPK